MNKKLKDIIFNTTRQWNPGDEFILMGCINILKEVFGNFNPIIFNRSPEISNSTFSNAAREIRLPDKFWEKPEILNKKAYYKIDFLDNSIKPYSDLEYADLAVFAGTPNWNGPENFNFYKHIVKNKIPAVILGVGNIGLSKNYEYAVAKKALFFSVRDKGLLTQELEDSCKTVYLPCPAMQVVKIGNEKTVSKLNTIGLVFAVNNANGSAANCVDDKTYKYIVNLYKNIIKKYNKIYNFKIICHYIDELSVAHELFDKINVDILYSYDSKDYISIYKQCDLILSPRVHGCGISSSLGIPSIGILHDFRGGTVNGFRTYKIDNNTSIDDVYSIIDKIDNEIVSINKQLIEHKKDVFNKYVDYLMRCVDLKRIDYDVNMNEFIDENSVSSLQDLPEIKKMSSKIPKTIWYVFDGEKSSFINSCIASWKVNCPDFDIIEINDKHPLVKKAEKNAFYQYCKKKNLYAPMSDILRLYAIYEYGGIYFDIDVQLLKPLNDLMVNNFIGIENEKAINGAVLGFEPKHPLIKRVVDFFDNEVMNSDFFTIPEVFKYCIGEVYNQKNFDINKNYNLGDLIIYSKEYFYPFDYNEKFSKECITKNTYTIHWWRGSWSSEENQNYICNRNNPSCDISNKHDVFNIFGLKIKIRRNKWKK